MSMLEKKDKKVICGGTILANGGLDTYINANPVPTTVGGIVAGSSFPSPGLTSQEMWDLLLYWEPPTFSTFLFFGITTLEVGDTINSAAQSIIWGTTNPANIAVNSIDIEDRGEAGAGPVVNLETGLATIPGVVAHDFSGSPITYNHMTNNVFRIIATDTNPTGPFNFARNLVINWSWMIYAGTDATTPLLSADIVALTDFAGLSDTFARTYSFGAGNYKYVCYPTVLGTATVFTDVATGFNVPFEAVYTVAIMNMFGVITNYNVHRSTNILGAAMDIAVS